MGEYDSFHWFLRDASERFQDFPHAVPAFGGVNDNDGIGSFVKRKSIKRKY